MTDSYYPRHASEKLDHVDLRIRLSRGETFIRQIVDASGLFNWPPKTHEQFFGRHAEPPRCDR